MPGPFACSTGPFVYHSHRAAPVLQEFGLVLQAELSRKGLRHNLDSGTKNEPKPKLFEPGYFPVGWGSSTRRGGGQKVRYAPRKQGNQTFLAGYPGILPGYPEVARKVWEKKVWVQFSFPMDLSRKKWETPRKPPGLASPKSIARYAKYRCWASYWTTASLNALPPSAQRQDSLHGLGASKWQVILVLTMIFVSLFFLEKARKTTQKSKNLFSVLNPQNTWERREKRSKKQGKSLQRKKQGKEDQGKFLRFPRLTAPILDIHSRNARQCPLMPINTG